MHRAFVCLFLVLGVALSAGPARGAEPQFPELTGRVVDEAGLLGESDKQELDRALAQFEKQTGDQIVVATLKSLQGVPIEDFGYQLGRHWGIGRKGKDNGALLIVAPEEREVRIEAGYGLEGELTDARSRTIIETEILPRFRQNGYPSGIKAGVAAMIQTLGGSYNPVLPPAQVRDQRAPTAFPFAVLLPIILVILFNRFFGGPRGRQGRRSYAGPLILPGGWSGRQDPFGGGQGGFGGGGFGGGGGGGMGGGGFSGGGGSFGGGGATGRW
jgi:uncharacterized protein